MDRKRLVRTRVVGFLLSAASVLTIVIAVAYSLALFASGAEKNLPEENTGENAPIEAAAGHRAEELSLQWEDPQEEEPAEEEIPWTDEDIEMLAKLILAEAGGTHDEVQQSAVVWCVLNRLDVGTFGDSIEAVVVAPHQFATFDFYPVTEPFRALAQDVLNRWWAEKNGTENVGRTLPAEYLYFEGDGEKNYFHAEWHDDDVWDWSLPDPYAE